MWDVGPRLGTRGGWEQQPLGRKHWVYGRAGPALGTQWQWPPRLGLLTVRLVGEADTDTVGYGGSAVVSPEVGRASCVGGHMGSTEPPEATAAVALPVWGTTRNGVGSLGQPPQLTMPPCPVLGWGRDWGVDNQQAAWPTWPLPAAAGCG